MYFSKFLLTAALAVSSALASPLVERAAPITPSALWKYSTNSGAIAATSTGIVSKSWSNAGKDLTALFTFTYPASATGRQCQFAFFLDSTATVQGSGKLDLFSSLAPAPGPRTTWPPGNQRNIHLGRLSVAKGSTATWDATYSTYLTQKTPCKPAGTKEGFELVGVYDNDLVTWNPALGAGPKLIVT